MVYYQDGDIIGWARDKLGNRFPIAREGAIPITKEEYEKAKQIRQAELEATAKQYSLKSILNYEKEAKTVYEDIYKRLSENIDKLQNLNVENPEQIRQFALELLKSQGYNTKGISCHRYAGAVSAIFDKHEPPIPYRCWQGNYKIFSEVSTQLKILNGSPYEITHVWVEHGGKIYETFSNTSLKSEYVSDRDNRYEIFFEPENE